jgi:hypothetical protein
MRYAVYKTHAMYNIYISIVIWYAIQHTLILISIYAICCYHADDGAGGPVGDSGEGGEGFENDEDVLADEVMQSYIRPFSETAAAISAAATAAARGSTTPPQIAMYLPAGPGARVGTSARLLNVESLFEVCIRSCYC